MKYFALIILTLFFVQSLSVVVKTQKVNLVEKKMKTNTEANTENKMQTNTNMKVKKAKMSTTGRFGGYPHMILRELNYYRRRNHYFPYIRWHNSLAVTAKKEAQHIAKRRSFGEHANFQTWRRKHRSKFFTELSLLVDTEGMVPNKRIFAKTIIEALKQEQEWYLIHPYTQAGVAIVPDRRRNHYVVVIHLVRRPARFHSCREALMYGIRRRWMHIFPRGKKVHVKCDQSTAGGGWTRILALGHNQHGRVIRGINDLHLHYKQVLFRAGPGYWFDYARGHRNNWDFNGYVFPLNVLKFGNRWWICRQRPTHGGLSNKLHPIFYNLNDKRVLQKRQSAGRCFFGRANRPQYCAREFIFKRIPKGRLNCISDVESVFNKWTGDNRWQQNYELFVR